MARNNLPEALTVCGGPLFWQIVHGKKSIRYGREGHPRLHRCIGEQGSRTRLVQVWPLRRLAHHQPSLSGRMPHQPIRLSKSRVVQREGIARKNPEVLNPLQFGAGPSRPAPYLECGDTDPAARNLAQCTTQRQSREQQVEKSNGTEPFSPEKRCIS